MNKLELYAEVSYLIMVYLAGSRDVAAENRLNLFLLSNRMQEAMTVDNTKESVRILYSVLLDLKWGYTQLNADFSGQQRMRLINSTNVAARLLDGLYDGTIVL